MTAITFDTLAYFEKLKVAGFSEEQAKVQAAAFREFSAIHDENTKRELVTKLDIVQMEMRIKSELTEKIESTKHETLKWLMGLIVAQTALIVAVLAYVK